MLIKIIYIIVVPITAYTLRYYIYYLCNLTYLPVKFSYYVYINIDRLKNKFVTYKILKYNMILLCL